MMLARIEDLLRQAIGLDAPSIGSSAIERAVQQRMRACQLDDPQLYWEHLGGSRGELQNLVEAVVVPETWFFRDRQAFAALANLLTTDRKDRAGPVRLLSLPCSTGEEPYTMAMALLDAGLAASDFRIDGVDISAHALARAQAGIYGRNSFRGSDLGFRDRYFVAIEGGYRLSDAVRGTVRLLQRNLFDPAFALDVERYDVIFCRNLLIYFDGTTQQRAIGILKRRLADDGLFFVGHSETGLLASEGFVSARIPMAFAFRRGPVPPTREALRATPARKKADFAAFWRKAPPVAFASFAERPPQLSPAPTIAAPDLAAIRRAADEGRLVEAAANCESYLERNGPSADALYLSGLIKDAAGQDAAAAERYRKALYLDPGHPESLAHLALLLAKKGDLAGAKLLRERAGRLSGKEHS